MKDSGAIVISVVVPVYNEEENLPVLIPKLMKVLEGLGCSFEMIFVDDGSSDGSRRILREMALQHPSLRVLRFRENRGLSAAKYNIRNRMVRSFIHLLAVKWMKHHTIRYDIEEKI